MPFDIVFLAISFPINSAISFLEREREPVIQNEKPSKTPLDLVYEWIHLKGKGVMHSSTGLAISAEDMLTMAPPEVIRWIVMKPQPNRHIDFDPGLGLLNMVDRYDQAEQDYHDCKMEENFLEKF